MDKPETDRERGSLLLPSDPGLPTPTGQGGQKRSEPHTPEANAETLLAASLLEKVSVQPDKPLPAVDPHTAWHQLLSEFALEIPSNQLDAWIQASEVLHYEDGHFIVGLPNAYYLDWAQDRLRPQIKRKLATILQRSSIDITFRVAPAPTARDLPPDGPAPLYVDPRERSLVTAGPVPAELTPAELTPAELIPAEPVLGPINPKYTFDAFVVGKHNRIAFAAAETIARDPGQRFNPLYIYGGVGLGKTHLLSAIGNQLAAQGYTVLYSSAEQFTNDLVNAIRNRSTEPFRAKYREIDALLLDDIQFIVGKDSTQEELFHTFNYLHSAGKQVIFTSDCPPRELARLEERLRNRFEGGLMTDIVAPDFETRVAILQTKAERQAMRVPYEVLMLIADHIKSNVRELEGALNNVWLGAQIHARALDVGLAESLLGSLTPRRSICAPVAAIERVAEYFGLTLTDLTGRRRTADVAHARQVAMYLLREEHQLSLPAIGEQLGGRDHSTVSYGIDRILQELQQSDSLRQAILRLREQLSQG